MDNYKVFCHHLVRYLNHYSFNFDIFYDFCQKQSSMLTNMLNKVVYFSSMNNTSKTLKINATIPENLLLYLDSYQKTHQLRSRSAALSRAIRALQELELQHGYEELGKAQLENPAMYPSENLDGIDLEDSKKWH